MKKYIFWMLYLIVGYTAPPCLAQSNMLSNGSFDGYFQTGAYPRFEEHLYDRNPSPWFQFNNMGDVRWFTDTVYTYSLQYPSSPDYQNGYYELGDFTVAYPWNEAHTFEDDMILQLAHSGKFYIGFDAKSDGLAREGFQTKVGTCGLNSGNYSVSLYYARSYQNDEEPHISISLSDQLNDRRHIVDEFDISLPYNSGQWYSHSANFQVDFNNTSHVGNDWFSITGQTFGNDDPRHYTYFDDIRLYRPCDELLECVPTHGQICPSYAFLQAPGDLMRISNIANASDLHLKVYASNSQLIKDTVYHNANGLPDFRLTRLGLPISTAAATYLYDLEITNLCGGVKKTGSIQVLDTASYNPITPYVDATANWSPAPIPCCLSTLTLQNMLIVGDVSYIVRDQITVQGGVSIAPGSHVTLQAGNVTELSNVEFDGSNSTLEIVEVPCPNRMACGNGCAGGDLVIDAGELVMPVQIAADSQATVKGNVAPTLPMEAAKPESGTETRLRAYPNPFEKEFQIGITLPAPMSCTVVVQDLQMRPIRTVLQAEELPAGSHQLAVDLGALPTGVYLVQLQAGGRSYHQRVVKQ